MPPCVCSSCLFYSCSLQYRCTCSRNGENLIVGRIRGMNGSCVWLLLQWPQSLSLRQVWGKSLSFSSILDHALVLVLRRQWKGGVHSWKHGLEKEGTALLCLRERRFQWRTRCWGFLQVQYLLRNTSHLPPFLSFTLELTSAESWGRPSHQQQVFLSSQKPQRVLISLLTRLLKDRLDSSRETMDSSENWAVTMTIALFSSKCRQNLELPTDTKFRTEAVTQTIKNSSVICVQEFSTWLCRCSCWLRS